MIWLICDPWPFLEVVLSGSTQLYLYAFYGLFIWNFQGDFNILPTNNNIFQYGFWSNF
jgi:hypothetical protein